MLDRAALKAVLKSVANEDGAAFRNLYLDRSDQLYALALRMLRDEGNAVEALQHTFVEVWRLAIADQANWDMPDLELIRICRRQSGEVKRRSDVKKKSIRSFEMGSPVKDGTASFELLSLLNTLGRMSGPSRDAVTHSFFENPTREELCERLDLNAEALTTCLRRCYAEYLTLNDTKPNAIDRETDLVAMNQAFGVSVVPKNAGPDSMMHAWELRIAPLAEVLQPISPPEGTFDAIMLRVNADYSTKGTRQMSRRGLAWRAALFLMMALVAAAIVHLGYIAISEDAAALAFINFAERTHD